MRLMQFGACLVGLAILSSAAVGAEDAAATPKYAVIQRIGGSGTDWDYAAVDPSARRLYIAQGGVTALDLDTGKRTTRLVKGKLTHGVVPLGHGLVAVDDSAEHTLTLFEGATGKVRAVIHIPTFAKKEGFHDPDALAYEPKTGLIIAVDGDSGDLVLVNQRKQAVVGKIRVGGDLEFPVANGSGLLYVNVSSANAIAVVNVVERRVVAHYPLKGCEEPTGLAFDRRNDLLISACVNGAIDFVDATSGHDLKTLKGGKEPDAVIFDEVRHLAFVPSGEAGTLNVIAVRSPSDIALIQTVPTQFGARDGAVDPKNGYVYLPTAKFKPPTATFPYPRAIEGTFQLLVVAPK